MLLDQNKVCLETKEVIASQTYVELATAAERLVELRAYENINELFSHGPRVCIDVHTGTAQTTCDDQRCRPERRISCTQWLSRQVSMCRSNWCASTDKTMCSWLR